jgi:DNA-directed RNA polymerase specialized sigma24 family protein
MAVQENQAMNSPAKKLLREYRDLLCEIEGLERERERMTTIATSPGRLTLRRDQLRRQDLDEIEPGTLPPARAKTRSVPKSDRIPEQIANIADLDEQISNAIGRAAYKRDAIERLITCLDSNGRRLIRMRYMELWTWDRIAEAYSVSVRAVHYTHKDILDVLNARLPKNVS